MNNKIAGYSFSLLTLFMAVVAGLVSYNHEAAANASTKIVSATQQHQPRKTLIGNNLNDCLSKLGTGGWCEIIASNKHRSISSVWPKDIKRRLRMSTGPSSVLKAWNGAAFDEQAGIMYFTGGGHADYGGNEVYQFNLNDGRWSRITDPSPLTRLYVLRDYNKLQKRPGRKLCWRGDNPTKPGSAHTYDGIIFSQKTQTIFLLSHGAAGGSCFEDKEDKYKNSPLIFAAAEGRGRGLYEFNPSINKTRNNLAPLSWRKVFSKQQMKGMSPNYPRTAELADGRLIIGTSARTIIYDPINATINPGDILTNQAGYGDGVMHYDDNNKLLWSLHRNKLLAFNPITGKSVHRLVTNMPNGKSIAIDKSGQLISWNGAGKIAILDPKFVDRGWQVINWRNYGPIEGDYRVYSKWVYLKKQDAFVGISSHKTGFWIYKHPKTPALFPPTVKTEKYSPLDLNNMIKKAKSGNKLVIKPGIYGQGLYINKSINLDLAGVSLRGISRSRAIININCNECEVIINNFNADGVAANCTNGNCAGIKFAGTNVRLRLLNSQIKNTAIGILTDNRGGGIIVDNSLIENTGRYNKHRRLGHGLYAGEIDSVIFRNSTIRSAFGNGHLFKSRATNTLIENSNIIGLNGRYSRIIDFPCGGSLVVKNSTLHHGKFTDNSDLFSIGTEKKHCKKQIPASTVIMTDNWIIIDRERTDDEPGKNRGTTRLFTWHAPIEQALITGNTIIEKTGQLKYDAKGRISGLKSKNNFFLSRKSAGLTSTELPLRH